MVFGKKMAPTAPELPPLGPMDSESAFKMALFQADLKIEFLEASAWAVACEAAAAQDDAHEVSEGFQRRYMAAYETGKGPGLIKELCTDMMDNYIVGAFAARKMGVPRDLPLVAWAARNKKDFPGWHGEIATIRTLLWAGFDPSTPDPSTTLTPLHCMVSLGWGEGVHSRAVQMLLLAGADPQARNRNGDTPLMTLCGNVAWNDSCRNAFEWLVEYGADPRDKSADGETAVSLLKQCQAQSPDVGRALLIAQTEVG